MALLYLLLWMPFGISRSGIGVGLGLRLGLGLASSHPNPYPNPSPSPSPTPTSVAWLVYLLCVLTVDDEYQLFTFILRFKALTLTLAPKSNPTPS